MVQSSSDIFVIHIQSHWGIDINFNDVAIYQALLKSSFFAVKIHHELEINI